MNVVDIKKRLIVFCEEQLDEKIKQIKLSIENAQKEANESEGAMVSRYDTFKEESQYLRGGFEKQLESLMEDKMLLSKINVSDKKRIQLGAIVKTFENLHDVNINKAYFISINISNEPISINNLDYYCIRYSSPFIKAIKNLDIGEITTFNERHIRIADIY